MRPADRSRRGAALLMAIACLALLAVLISLLTKQGFAARRASRAEERRLRAAWLAESGLELSWAKLAADPSYRGETWTISPESLKGRDAATVLIALEPIKDDPDHLRATSRADFPREGSGRARETRTALFPKTPTPAPGDAR